MDAEAQVVLVYLRRYSTLYEEHEEERKRAVRIRSMSVEEETCSQSSNNAVACNGQYNVPIVGYEIVEQRERFTVYKIRVEKLARSWFVFRRYSDFERLNEKLSCAFRTIKLKIPPKRRFGDNFNPDFIAKRAEGLQRFISAILQHENMRTSHPVHEFFCLDDPPGPFDSLEESRAYVQYMEEQMENQRNVITGLSSQLDATKSQLEQARVQIKSLECTLRSERLQRGKTSQPNHSTPAVTSMSASCGRIDAQLSDISDDGATAAAPKAVGKSRKSVSFANMTKAASEGNLLMLKHRAKLAGFPSLKDQTANNFRHSITFGDDTFVYGGFLDVALHSNVTDKIKERGKRKSRKRRERGSTSSRNSETRNKESANCSRESNNSCENNDVVLRTSSRPKDRCMRDKRDSGIIRDSFTTGTDSES